MVVSSQLLWFVDLMNVTEEVTIQTQRFDTPVYCLHQG